MNPYAPPATESRQVRKWLPPIGVERFLFATGWIALGVAYGLYPLIYAIVCFFRPLDPKYAPTMFQLLKAPFLGGGIMAFLSFSIGLSSWVVRNMRREP